MKKYETPKMDCENNISFTCSEDSVEKLIKLMLEMHSLGEMGSTRDLSIYWDGDGRDKLNNISINGLTLEQWDEEFKRLENIRNNY
jgi:hypothetical protein